MGKLIMALIVVRAVVAAIRIAYVGAAWVAEERAADVAGVRERAEGNVYGMPVAWRAVQVRGQSSQNSMPRLNPPPPIPLQQQRWPYPGIPPSSFLDPPPILPTSHGRGPPPSVQLTTPFSLIVCFIDV